MANWAMEQQQQELALFKSEHYKKLKYFNSNYILIKMKKICMILIAFMLTGITIKAQTWSTYNSGNSPLPDGDIYGSVIDLQNNKWFSCYSHGLYKFDGTSWTTYSTSNGLVTNYLYGLAVDLNGDIWVGTDGQGVLKFNGTSWTQYNLSNGLAGSSVARIYIDNQGNKWFGTTGGISKYDGTTWTTYNTSNGLANNHVYDIIKDNQNNMWIATYGGGISKFDGTTWTTYNTTNGLASNFVKAIAVDNNDNKWFGTAYGGVSKFDGTTWTTYTKLNGLSANEIEDIVVDSIGNIWFATYGNEIPNYGGITKYDGTNWTVYRTSNGLAHNNVWSIFIDNQSKKWFSTSQGVSILNDIIPLVISPNSISFESGGEDKTTSLTANGSWTSSGVPSWITMTPTTGSSGTVTLNLTAQSNTGSARSATITFTNSTTTETLSLSQAATTSSFNITTTSNPTIGGATIGGGTYQIGQSCAVIATPNSGYSFANWTENGSQVSTNTSYAFTVSSNRTLVANFTSNTYSIDLQAYNSNGTVLQPAWGTVTGGGSGKVHGSTVTLTATPVAGYYFVGWEYDLPLTIIATQSGYPSLNEVMNPSAHTATLDLTLSGPLTNLATFPIKAKFEIFQPYIYAAAQGFDYSGNQVTNITQVEFTTLYVSNIIQTGIDAAGVFTQDANSYDWVKFVYGNPDQSLIHSPVTVEPLSVPCQYKFVKWERWDPLSHLWFQVSPNLVFTFIPTQNYRLRAIFEWKTDIMISVDKDVMVVPDPLATASILVEEGNNSWLNSPNTKPFSPGELLTITVTPAQGYFTYGFVTPSGTAIPMYNPSNPSAGGMIKNTQYPQRIDGSNGIQNHTIWQYVVGCNPVDLRAVVGKMRYYAEALVTPQSPVIGGDVRTSIPAQPYSSAYGYGYWQEDVATGFVDNNTNRGTKGWFDIGTNITFKAVASPYQPALDWMLEGWYLGSQLFSLQNDINMTIEDNITLEARFYNAYIPPSWEVIATANPTDAAMPFTFSPAGPYLPATSVTITAHAQPGWDFVSWSTTDMILSVPQTTANPLTINTPSPGKTVNLVANFNQNTGNYTITTSSNPTAGGTTTGGGTFTSDSSRTVTATASNGYTFSNWTEGGNVVSNNASYTFTLSGNRTLVANFTQNPQVKIGSVTSGPGQLLVPVEMLNFLHNVSAITFRITANSNLLTFEGLSNVIGFNSAIAIQNGNTLNIGYFDLIGYQPNGKVFDLRFNYTAASSTNLDFQIELCEVTEGINPISNITYTNGVITASAGTNYTITTSSNPTAGGTTSGGGSYASGSTGTVTATANNGYTFSNWTDGGNIVSTNEDYTFTVNGNRTLVANFTLNPVNYTITTSSNPTAGGTTSGGGTFDSGSSRTVTATASNGYTFSNWTEGATVVSNNAYYTFTVSGNRTLVANFTATDNTLTGSIKYFNPFETTMPVASNFSVGLYNSTNLVSTSTLDYSGKYNFSGIQQGVNYTLKVLQSGIDMPFGGVSAADALIANYLAIQSPILGNYAWIDPTAQAVYTPFANKVADVNSSNAVTALDALTILYRTVNNISAYLNNTPDFQVAAAEVPHFNAKTYPSAPVHVFNFSAGEYAGNWTGKAGETIMNIYYIASGDINASYIPNEDPTTVNLNYNGQISANVGDIVSIPISIDQNVAQLGAITLDISFNNSIIEVISIHNINSNLINVQSNIDNENGIIRLAWADLVGFNVSANENIFSIVARVLTPIDAENRYFELVEAEFNHINTIPIPGITLSTKSISSVLISADTIPLNAGWNLISLDVIPQNAQATAVFSSLIGSNNLVEVKGFHGQQEVVFKPSNPSGNNTLSSLIAGMGYWVKVNTATVLTIEGSAIPEDFAINLNAGWNLVGYWHQQSASVTESMEQLINAGIFEGCSGFETEGKFYDLQAPLLLNTLETISNSKGYWIKVSSNFNNFNYIDSTSLNDGLVAHYPFNGNAQDESGKGNHGVVNGATLTVDRFGNENQAYDFAGISNPQTIMVPNSTSLQFTDAATFSFWVNMNSFEGMDGWGNWVPNGNHVLFAKDYDMCCPTGAIQGLANGEFVVGFGSGSGGIGCSDTLKNSSINQWHNIVYVISPTQTSIYADGNLLASQIGSVSFTNSNIKNLWFGRLIETWYPFNGKMDDIRIYDRALNPSEISDLYHEGGWPLPDLNTGLVAYYPFNGNANDGSGTGNNGTIIGDVNLTTDRYGNANSAYDFPGLPFNYINVPHHESLSLDTMTLVAWIYTETDYGHGQILQKNRDIESGHYGLCTTNINATISYGNSVYAFVNEPPETGSWHMVAGILSGNTAQFYVDGILMADTVAPSAFTYSGTQPLAIGMHFFEGVPDNWTYPYKGKLDDLRIYNRVLSSSEIQALYSIEQSFVCGQAFSDPRDSRTYNTVLIGDQCWMKENLAYLPTVSPPSQGSENDPFYYVYNYQSTDINEAKATENYQNYGVLYNWPASLASCPTGWHLPSDDEWTVLSDFLGGQSIAGGKLKSTRTTPETHPRWESPNEGATNESNFSGFPGGYSNTNGSFTWLGSFGWWWSSTENSSSLALHRIIGSNDGVFTRSSFDKVKGFSVRCLRDTTATITYSLSLVANPSGSGTATGGGQYESGYQVSITAEASTGWQFVNWTDASDQIVNTQSSFIYTMPAANTVLTANFTEQQTGFSCGQAFTDPRDGRTYNTVLIGEQCWMKENLNIGTRIDVTSSQTNNGTIEKYCYNNTETNCVEYGGLYQWNEIMEYSLEQGTKGICPDGWHLPTDLEWTTLVTYLGGESIAGGKLKEIGTSHWAAPNTGADNSSNFTALPGGILQDPANPTFINLSFGAFLWSSNQVSSFMANFRSMGHDNIEMINVGGFYSKSGAMSVRCLKN